jgi:PEP-CTERM motif
LQAGTLTVGGPPLSGTGNCDPFGCPGFFNLGTYQQVYASNAFPGIETISELTFQDTQLLNAGVPGMGTYTLSFSYSNAGPGSLSTVSPSTNISSGSALFYTGTLPAVSGVPGDRLLVFSGTPFLYNPAFGDLLLTVSVTGPADNKPPLYLDVAQSTAQTSEVYFGTDGINAPDNEPGLITQFLVSPGGSAVPEPNSALLMLAGAGLIAGWWRKRSSRS